MKLPRSFYTRDDVVQIARELLGKKLCTEIGGTLTSGMIVETEAYRGWGDRACHARENRCTPRTKIFYQQGGVAYVYLCYGIHHLFNIITNEKERADAVLIRAVQPIDGVEVMMRRRNLSTLTYRLTSGPGALSQALGITTRHYGTDLLGNTIWLEEYRPVYAKEIVAGPRIGVNYAGPDALLPWRFWISDNPWVSKVRLSGRSP